MTVRRGCQAGAGVRRLRRRHPVRRTDPRGCRARCAPKRQSVRQKCNVSGSCAQRVTPETRAALTSSAARFPQTSARVPRGGRGRRFHPSCWSDPCPAGRGRPERPGSEHAARPSVDRRVSCTPDKDPWPRERPISADHHRHDRNVALAARPVRLNLDNPGVRSDPGAASGANGVSAAAIRGDQTAGIQVPVRVRDGRRPRATRLGADDGSGRAMRARGRASTAATPIIGRGTPPRTPERVTTLAPVRRAVSAQVGAAPLADT